MILHSITRQSYADTTFGERLALQMMSTSLWPFKTDDRIGLLISMLATELAGSVEDDEQVEAILDQLRMHLMAARYLR